MSKEREAKMKYVILVSHGNFAEGLLDSLKMLTGNHDDVIAIGLKMELQLISLL